MNYLFVRSIAEKVIALLLLILFLPIFCLLIILILVFEHRPVFYLQERLGQNNNKFLIIKFRTMKLNAESNQPIISPKNDRRFTRLGYWLNNFYLNELPQLINILKGEMSFVGPRPERPYFHAIFSKKYQNWQKRLTAPQGMIGWSQLHIVGSLEPKKKLFYDLQYIDNLSFWFDIKIVYLTLILYFSILIKFFINIFKVK